MRVNSSYVGWEDSNNDHSNRGGNKGREAFDFTSSSVLWDDLPTGGEGGGGGGGGGAKWISEKDSFVQALSVSTTAPSPGLGSAQGLGLGGCSVVGVYGPPHSGKSCRLLHVCHEMWLQHYHLNPQDINEEEEGEGNEEDGDSVMMSDDGGSAFGLSPPTPQGPGLAPRQAPGTAQGPGLAQGPGRAQGTRPGLAKGPTQGQGLGSASGPGLSSGPRLASSQPLGRDFLWVDMTGVGVGVGVGGGRGSNFNPGCDLEVVSRMVCQLGLRGRCASVREFQITFARSVLRLMCFQF